MIESMATVRITEAELARDVRAVLEKIERGSEVIIEREDHRPVAVMKQPQPVGRKISECIALAKAYEEKLGYAPVPTKTSDLIGKVKGFYAAFSRGDIATILASVADDVSWEFEAPSELLSSGIRRSPKEVAEYFSAVAGQNVDHNLEMTEFFATDDAVAAFGRYQGTVKSSGIRVDTPLAHYFKFRDGKVVRHVQLANTGATLEAIRGRSAG